MDISTKTPASTGNHRIFSKDITDKDVYQCADCRCAGNRHDPGTHHGIRHIPVYCTEPLCPAHPIMEPVTTCVVDTGRCRKVAVKIVNAELISAASPFTGSKRNILFPTVRIMRQPPTLVPAHMANAQAIFTRKGTSSSPMYPPDKSASVMIPCTSAHHLNRGKMPLPRRISSVYGEKYNSLSISPHSGTG